MNAEWSQLNKMMQNQLKSRASFDNGIETLLTLRKSLMEQIIEFRQTLQDGEFAAMPFPNAMGYHNKTVAYSLFHIFRIEDNCSQLTDKKSGSGVFGRKLGKKDGFCDNHYRK